MVVESHLEFLSPPKAGRDVTLVETGIWRIWRM